MSYLLGMEKTGQPFCIHQGIIVDVREYRSSAGGVICGSEIKVDARKINLSTIHTTLMPSDISARLCAGHGAALPVSAHPRFISVPVLGQPRHDVTIGVPMIVKMEPIIEDGQVRGTNIYRHGKALSDPKPVATSLAPSVLYQKLGIPAPGAGGLSDFVFIPNEKHPNHPECYATSVILKVNSRKDFNGHLIGTTLLLDQGGLQGRSAIDLTQKPMDFYRMLGLSVPKDVAQYYHPRTVSLKANFPLTPNP